MATSFRGLNRANAKDAVKRVQKKQDDLCVQMTVLRGNDEGDMAELAGYNPPCISAVQRMLDEEGQWRLECREMKKRRKELDEAEDKLQELQTADDLPLVTDTDPAGSRRKIALRTWGYLLTNNGLVPELVNFMDPQTREKFDKAVVQANADGQASQVQYEENPKTAAEAAELRDKVAGLESELAAARTLLQDRTTRLETVGHELKDAVAGKDLASDKLKRFENKFLALVEAKELKHRSLALFVTANSQKQEQISELEDQIAGLEEQMTELEEQAADDSAEIESLTDEVQALKERLGVEEQETAKAQESEARRAKSEAKALDRAKRSKERKANLLKEANLLLQEEKNRVARRDQTIADEGEKLAEQIELADSFKQQYDAFKAQYDTYKAHQEEEVIPELLIKVARLGARTQEVATLKNRVVVLSNDKARLGNELQLANLSYQTYQRDRAALELRATTLGSDASALRSDLNSARGELRQKRLELRDAQQLVSDLKRDLEVGRFSLQLEESRASRGEKALQVRIENQKASMFALLEGMTAMEYTAIWSTLVDTFDQEGNYPEGLALPGDAWILLGSLRHGRDALTSNPYMACLDLYKLMGGTSTGLDAYECVLGAFSSLSACETMHQGLVEAVVDRIVDAARGGHLDFMLGLGAWQLISMLVQRWPALGDRANAFCIALKVSLGGREVRLIESIQNDRVTEFVTSDGLSNEVRGQDAFVIHFPSSGIRALLLIKGREIQWIGYDCVDSSDMFGGTIQVKDPSGEVAFAYTPSTESMGFFLGSGV